MKKLKVSGKLYTNCRFNTKRLKSELLLRLRLAQKRFAVAFVFLLHLLVSDFGRTNRSFFLYFIYCCSRRVRPISELLTQYIVCFHAVCLETNKSDRCKPEHVESCPLTIKNIIFPLPQSLRFGRVVTYNERLPPIKSHDSLIAWSSEIT